MFILDAVLVILVLTFFVSVVKESTDILWQQQASVSFNGLAGSWTPLISPLSSSNILSPLLKFYPTNQQN